MPSAELCTHNYIPKIICHITYGSVRKSIAYAALYIYSKKKKTNQPNIEYVCFTISPNIIYFSYKRQYTQTFCEQKKKQVKNIQSKLNKKENTVKYLLSFSIFIKDTFLFIEKGFDANWHEKRFPISVYILDSIIIKVKEEKNYRKTTLNK